MARIKLTDKATKKLRALVSARPAAEEADAAIATTSPIAGSTGTFSGTVSASAFVGPLTGSVTGDADNPEVAIPAYRSILASTGYTALDAIYRMQEVSGDLKSRGNAADPSLLVAATPTFGYMLNGLQGIHIDAAGDYFGANVLDPANGSLHWAHVFAVLVLATDKALVGRTGARGLYSEMLADNKVYARINDGTRSLVTSAVGNTALVAGGVYLLQKHLRKDAGTLKLRLSRRGTGLLGSETSDDVSLYTTLSGGAGPTFQLGASGSYWGAGIVHLGFMARHGAEVEAAGKMAALAGRLGFE